MRMSELMGVKLDEQTIQRLKSLSKQHNRTPHWLMKTAIEVYLDREEAYEREKQEDLERWERYSISGKFIPQDRVAAWLDELAGKNDALCPQ
jgi:predicted transcriptional regulator